MNINYKNETGASILEYSLALAVLFGGFLIGGAIYYQAQQQRYEASINTISDSMAPCEGAILDSGASADACY